MTEGKMLIDGDIIAYRAAFSAKDGSSQVAKDKADEVVNFILDQAFSFPSPEDFEMFLTGGGNFRFDIAKSYPYKGNRKKTEKPKHLGTVRNHLIEAWGAVVSEGEEADDLIAIAATKIGPTAIVASIDKDMLQIPCEHFNFGKNEWSVVNKFEGLKFFYTQMLTGDRADNIIGLHRVGPVKAKKMLKGCNTEEELWEAVLNAYDGDLERVLENARLLWLRRYEGELWEPPKGETSD